MADGTSETSNDGVKQAAGRSSAPVNAVFAASGVHPHGSDNDNELVGTTASAVSSADAGGGDEQQQPSDAEYAVRVAPES